jgi:hypothetical protein
MRKRILAVAIAALVPTLALPATSSAVGGDAGVATDDYQKPCTDPTQFAIDGVVRVTACIIDAP